MFVPSESTPSVSGVETLFPLTVLPLAAVLAPEEDAEGLAVPVLRGFPRSSSWSPPRAVGRALGAAIPCSPLLSPSRAVVLAGVGVAEGLAVLCRGRVGPRSPASSALSPSRAVEVAEVEVSVELVVLGGEVVGLVLGLAV